MNFVPGLAAATAYETGEVGHDGTKKIEGKDSTLEVTPEMYENVLKQMKKDAEIDIKEDEKKLKKEAKIIDHLQEKLEKEERKLEDMREILDEEEELDTETDEEKLRKAERKLEKLREGDDKSPVQEKIEEVLSEVKETTKNVLDNVAEYAHLMFANEKESKRCERALEKDRVIDEKDEPDKYESKTQKKLNEAAKRVEDLKNNLIEKRKAMIEGDDAVLEKRTEKIRHLEQELEEEERKYATIVAALTEDMKYEARIREEERKLREMRLGALT